MTSYDVQVAEALELVLNVDEVRERTREGISYFIFEDKTFVVAKHSGTGRCVVLGLKDPSTLTADDTAVITEVTMLSDEPDE